MVVTPETYEPDLYAGNGATTVFPVTFPFFEETVTLIVDLTGAETIFVRDVNYTLSGGEGSTGTVTIKTSPTDFTPATGETLLIERTTVRSQDTEFDLDNQVTQDALQTTTDRTYMIVQEEVSKEARAIKLTSFDFDSLGEVDFPSPISNTAITWNAAANELRSTPIADISSSIAAVVLPLDLTAGVLSLADGNLLSIENLASAADTLPYFTGSEVAALTTLTSFGRTLIDDASASVARVTLGLVIGTDVPSNSAIGDSILLRNDAATGAPDYEKISSLTAKSPLARDDKFILEESGGSLRYGELRNMRNWDLLSTTTISNDSSFDVTFLSSDYSVYKLLIQSLQLVNDATTLFIRTSTTGGSPYDSGATDYQSYVRANDTTTTGDRTDVLLVPDMGNATDETYTGEVYIHNFIGSAANKCTIMHHGISNSSAAGGITYSRGGGRRNSTGVVNAFSLIAAGSNLDTGRIRVYRLRGN